MDGDILKLLDWFKEEYGDRFVLNIEEDEKDNNNSKWVPCVWYPEKTLEALDEDLEKSLLRLKDYIKDQEVEDLG